tara:strand:- start:54 stop:623 length:570 start_codon:yes stop_codon:yes gene_type:complete
MTQELYKYLDKKISLTQLEEFIYKSPKIESEIGENNYQTLLEFNFNKKNADLEIQNFLLREVVQENEFSNWKVNLLLQSLELENNPNIFNLITKQPNLLRNKKLLFNQFGTNIKVEIIWKNEISQYHRHISELKNEVKFLHLGTYDNSYIHLLINKDNEIWVGYDIINKEEYYAENLFEAIKKLLLQKG